MREKERKKRRKEKKERKEKCPETGYYHVAQASLKFLGSSHPPASASQSAGIAGVNHKAQPCFPYV